MAVGSQQLIWALVTVAIIVIVMLWTARMAKQMPATPAADKDTSDDGLLCKFAMHEGAVVGETVAFDGDRLILKQGGTYRAVALSQAQNKEGEVMLTGDIDWASADAAGSAWYAAHRQSDAAEVAGELTKSEDVRSPALEAFKAREEE